MTWWQPRWPNCSPRSQAPRSPSRPPSRPSDLPTDTPTPTARAADHHGGYRPIPHHQSRRPGRITRRADLAGFAGHRQEFLPVRERQYQSGSRRQRPGPDRHECQRLAGLVAHLCAASPANFYLEGTFSTHDCSGSDLYGLVFRATKDNAGYFFGVTCDGRYNLYARDFNNNTDTELIALKPAPGSTPAPTRSTAWGCWRRAARSACTPTARCCRRSPIRPIPHGYFGAFVAANQTAGFRSIWTRSNYGSSNQMSTPVPHPFASAPSTPPGTCYPAVRSTWTPKRPG